MKKLFFTSIAILLCMGMLAACAIQSAPASTPAAAATSVAPTATASAAAAATAGEQRPALLTDANVNLPGTLPVAKETATLTIGMAQSETVTSYAYGENFQTTWMQDKSNVKLELQLFPSTDANQKLDLMISSNSPLPDILIGMGIEDDGVRYKYGKAGVIIPLNEYYAQLATFFDKYLAKHANDADYLSKEAMLKYVSSPDGKLYGMVGYSVTLPSYCSQRAWINQKWLDTLKLAEPTTSDELVQVLTAFRDKDPNGNSKKDEIPMVGSVGGWHSDPIRWIMNQFIYVQSEDDFYVLDSGKIDTAYDKDAWREGLRFTKSLIDNKLLSTLSFTQDFNQYKAMVAGDTQIIGIGVSGSISGFGANKPDYNPVGAIKGANGAQWATYVPQLPFSEVAITKDCKSPSLAFRWLEMGYESDDYAMITRYGEPNVDWAYASEGTTMYSSLGYKPFFKVINNNWGNAQQKNWECYPLPYLQYSVINQGEVWDGNKSNNEYKNSLAIAKLMEHTPAKENIIFKINYTDAELEQYAELRSVLQTYVKESMVRFVMGDLNLDNGWDEYLSELNKLKYKEILAMDQAAYNRTMGK